MIFSFSVCTVLVSLFYCTRFKYIESRVAFSDDILYLTTTVLALTAWNIVLHLLGTSLPQYSDLRIFIIMVVSIALFKFFSLGIMRVMEMISFQLACDSATIPDDWESNKKSVKFDDFEQVVSYLEEKISMSNKSTRFKQVTHCTKYWLKKVSKLVAIYLCITLFCIFFIPRSMIFVSTKTLYFYSDSLYLKTEHILFALEIEFLVYVLLKFCNVLKHPRFKHFPYLTTIASIFIWLYSSAIWLVNVNGSIIFNDAILILQDPDSYTSSSDNFISILTANCISGWLDHYSTGETNLSNKLDAKIQFIREIATLTWSVINLINFIIVPLIIWVIIVEIRLRRVAL